MSFFEIGVYHTKTEVNIGTLWRSAVQLGASGVFTIGRRYKKQSSDTYGVSGFMPVRHYIDFEDFTNHRPSNAILVGVEMGGIPLSSFTHPKNVIYLLGAEDNGIPPKIMERCNTIVSVEAVNMLSYNVAVAGSIVIWHRMYGGIK